MAHGNDTHSSGPGLYIVVALILGVITYIEYYIVEFPPIWMSSAWVMFWLILLSVAKFLMVIWFFMHLRDDDKLYTGFFASGMVIAMGTFVVLVAVFLFPRAVAPAVAATQPPAIPAHAADPYPKGLDAEMRALIDTDGLSRPIAARTDAPRPKDQSLRISPPAAAEGLFALRVADEEPAVDPDADPAAAAAPAPEEREGDAPTLAAVADPTFDRELGAQAYAQSCSGCHGPTGAGIPGVFPPLAGHALDLYQADGGRTYLIDVLLYGLQGPIEVAGQTYNGVMPAWQQLSDEQIAAIVNHAVVGFDAVDEPDDFDAIRPDEVAAERGKGLTPSDVHALRQDLGPAEETDPEVDAEEVAEPEVEPDAEPEAEVETETEPEVEEDAADEPDTVVVVVADPTFDRDLGARVYTQNCSACHQATGAGIPGVFPPLAGHALDLYQADGGRTYLIDVILYGLQGPIEVDGRTYAGLMPPFAQLSDEQIAAVLNHSVVGFDTVDDPDDFDAIRPDEVAAERGKGLSATDVHGQRMALGLD
jgi:mono/diheme cytochrome c family protein